MVLYNLITFVYKSPRISTWYSPHAKNKMLAYFVAAFRRRLVLWPCIHGIQTLRFSNRAFFGNTFNPLNAELNPICHLLALLGVHHFLHVSRIRVKSLTLRLLMIYIYIYIYMYGVPILDVSRSHTTTHHSR